MQGQPFLPLLPSRAAGYFIHGFSLSVAHSSSRCSFLTCVMKADVFQMCPGVEGSAEMNQTRPPGPYDPAGLKLIRSLIVTSIYSSLLRSQPSF